MNNIALIMNYILVSLFVGSNVMGSHNYELVSIPGQGVNTTGANGVIEIPLARTLKSSSINDSKCAYTCIKGAVALCILAGIGFGFGFEPHTYRVYNGKNSNINVHYRPGCTRKRGKSTVSVDCIKTVEPDKHAKIMVHGHLTKLCATSVFGYSGHCATYEGLQHNFNWCVDNSFKFSRCDGLSNLNTTNFISDVMPVNFTSKELADIDQNLLTQQEYITSYLRGSLAS